MRDRLIELLLKSEPLHERDLDDDLADGEIEAIADHLLANGVIVLPVKVGQILYGHRARVIEYRVTSFLIQGNDIIIYGVDDFHECAICTANDIGKGEISLTREEAVEALERSKNGN